MGLLAIILRKFHNPLKSVHGPLNVLFHLGRHRMSALHDRLFRDRALPLCKEPLRKEGRKGARYESYQISSHNFDAVLANTW
jgi:hypothetical protein